MPNAEFPVFAKTAVLQVLQHEPGYGSQIVQRINESTDGAIKLAAGSIYPVLRTLENEGLVAKIARKKTDKGHKERYKLTGKGLRTTQRNKKIVRYLFGV